MVETVFYLYLLSINIAAKASILDMISRNNDWPIFFNLGYACQFIITEFLAGFFCLDRQFIELFNYPVYDTKVEDTSPSLRKYARNAKKLLQEEICWTSFEDSGKIGDQNLQVIEQAKKSPSDTEK